MAVRAIGNSARMGYAVLVAIVVASNAAGQSPSPKAPPADGIPITLPGGVVIVIGGKPKPPPKADPVILTAEQYKELLDKLAKLQAQVDAQRPARPRSCELEGKVEVRGRQPVVRLRATFKFTTTRPNTLIHLGCQKAHAVEAKADDGKTPILTASDDGLRVLAESPGDHTVRLELDLALGARGPKGAEQGFEVGLPGAPITALTFEPPTGVRRYTLTTRTPRSGGPAGADSETEQPEAERFLPGKGGAPLGPITTLALSWEDPERKTDTPRSAEAETVVTVGASELVTETKWHLRGPAAEWKFTAPASADVTVAPWSKAGGAKAADFGTDRAPNVLRPDPGQSVWRVVFRESFNGDLLVTVVARQPRPRGGEPATRGPFPIGPYVVLNVPQQNGTIRVRAPSNLRPTASLKGETTRETEEGSGDTVYRFRQAETATAPKDPHVTLTLTPLPGAVNARVRHELRLTESGWKLRSEIAVSPARTEVEFVDVELPSSFRPAQAEPPEIVEELAALREAGPDRPVYRVRLTTPRRSSFTFTLEGDYPLPAGPGSASLAVPRLLGVAERSAELVAIAPPRFDLRGSIRTSENGKPGNWSTPLVPEASDAGSRVRVLSERPIGVVELAWRPVASAAALDTEADVDVEESRIRVYQRMRFRFTGQVPDRIHLRSARPVLGVHVTGGLLESAGEGWNILFSDPTARDQEVRLAYSAPLTAGDTPIALPLLMAELGLASQTVRVWTTRPATLTLAEPGDWHESATEIVAGRVELPGLVVKARGATTPPIVQARPLSGGADPGLSLERVRIDVTLGNDDASYRCQYWLRDWRKDAELLLPAGARAIELFVQGKKVPATAEAAANGEARRIIVRRPAGTTGVAIVELRYRSLNSVLEAPTLGNAVIDGGVTWAVTAQPGSIVLVPGAKSGGWTLGAFLGVLGFGSQTVAGLNAADASDAVIVHQTNVQPVSVYQLPRTPWVLGCSVAVAALCWLAISLAGRRRRIFFAVVVVGFLAGAILISQPLAQATFAGIPGLVAVVAFASVFRWLRLQHRRRVARVVGFARPGSTLIRPSVSSSRHREAAAEDQPAPAAAPSSS